MRGALVGCGFQHVNPGRSGVCADALKIFKLAGFGNHLQNIESVNRGVKRTMQYLYHDATKYSLG